MKLPRFTLRALFLLIALIAIALSWSVYELNWIRQRHEFIQRYSEYETGGMEPIDRWPDPPLHLRSFGEKPKLPAACGERDLDRMYSLFPERPRILLK
jgi:hypothetical protein